jgi:hypothetical protein
LQLQIRYNGAKHIVEGNPNLGIDQSQMEDIERRLKKVEKWVHAGIQKVGGDYF